MSQNEIQQKNLMVNLFHDSMLDFNSCEIWIKMFHIAQIGKELKPIMNQHEYIELAVTSLAITFC